MNALLSSAARTALGVLVCTHAAAAGDLPASILAPVGQTAVYHATFDGHFWNGEKRHSDEKVAVRANSAAAATISDLLTTGAAPITCEIGRDGTLAVAKPTSIVLELNAAGALLAGLPAAPHVGSGWKSTVTVRTSPDATAAIPVDVRVAAIDASGVLLQATGTTDATMSYAGMPLPISLTIRMAELVGGARVERAAGNVDEHVAAGPFSQDMGWQWALVHDASAG